MTETDTIRIDTAAKLYYATKDKKHFEEIGVILSKVIRVYVAQKCAGSIHWNKDDLFAILLEDMWRLFRVYKPEEGKKFHWLMLRQFSNKTRNYIKNTTGQKYKNCFVCSHSHNSGEDTCTKCGSSLRKPRESTGYEHYDFSHKHTPDYLTDIANSQTVERLLKATESDPKTHQILRLILEDYNGSDISAKVKIAPNAMNNRIKKCRSIIRKLEVPQWKR